MKPSDHPTVLLRLHPFFLLTAHLGVCLLTLSARPVLAQDLRAGVARIDITPTLPVTLAGYEARKELSQGVHDPLSARVIAFEQNGLKLVLVSTDNLGFYSGTADAIRTAILEACRLKPSELFLCAIHTHSAPSLTLDVGRGHSNNVEYTKGLQGKLVEVIRTAMDRMAPVQVAVGVGSSPVGVNRRQVIHTDDGKTKIALGRNPSVDTDREVQVLKLTRPGDQRLAGVLFDYATHSTSMGTKNYFVSGDIHGLAEQFLEKYLGSEVVAPGFAGASGDIDPWVRVLPDFRTDRGWIPESVLMGTMLGEEVARVLEGIQSPSTAKCLMKSSFKTVELPAKARGEAQANPGATAKFNVTVARLGEIAFVGWGGEVFNDVGKAVKSGSPFRHTFVITHCNGTAGYMPTRPAYPEGGYEVQSSSFAPGASDMLAEQTLAMLRELQSGAE